MKIIKKVKPNLIHCNSTTGGIVGRICGALSFIPVIFTANGWAFTDGISKSKQVFYKILETILAVISKKIICVSEYDRQIALKVMPLFKNKLITIHNGICFFIISSPLIIAVILFLLLKISSFMNIISVEDLINVREQSYVYGVAEISIDFGALYSKFFLLPFIVGYIYLFLFPFPWEWIFVRRMIYVPDMIGLYCFLPSFFKNIKKYLQTETTFYLYHFLQYYLCLVYTVLH